MEYLALNNGVRMPLVGCAEARAKRACARHSTAVACMFAPPEREKQVYLEGDAAGKTDTLFAILTGKKII